MKRVSSDYINLKKSINSYIDKVKTPNRKENEEALKELDTLRNSTIQADKDRYIKLRNDLALANGGFAMKYSMQYYIMLNEDASISDLFQEAMVGITEAIDAYDIGKDVSFTTYAFYHVRKRLIDYIKKIKLVRAPRDIARNIKHVNEASDKLLTSNQREPNANEIGKFLKNERGIDMDTDMIENIMRLITLNSIGSDDSFIVEYQEHLSNEENEVMVPINYDVKSNLVQRMEVHLDSSLRNLSEEEQKIIKLRFGINKESPHCMEEIDVILGKDVSREN